MTQGARRLHGATMTQGVPRRERYNRIPKMHPPRQPRQPRVHNYPYLEYCRE